METVNVGFGDIVLTGRMVAIVAPTSMSAKRMVQDARDAGRLIDATYKRRTRAVVVMDSGHIVLSALLPETIAGRMGSRKEARGRFVRSFLRGSAASPFRSLPRRAPRARGSRTDASTISARAWSSRR